MWWQICKKFADLIYYQHLLYKADILSTDFNIIFVSNKIILAFLVLMPFFCFFRIHFFIQSQLLVMQRTLTAQRTFFTKKLLHVMDYNQHRLRLIMLYLLEKTSSLRWKTLLYIVLSFLFQTVYYIAYYYYLGFDVCYYF